MECEFQTKTVEVVIGYCNGEPTKKKFGSRF